MDQEARIGQEHCLPRVAIYDAEALPPRLAVLDSLDPSLAIEQLTDRVVAAVRQQGGRVPTEAVAEIVANLVHAGFEDVVVTVADSGNTVRVADRGPGIPDKEKALRTGFTTAGPHAKSFIRGVGAGLSLARAWLQQLGGDLELEDNLLGGTVVSLTVPPGSHSLDPGPPPPATPLSPRQLQVLLLVVELGPIGPTQIAREMGISSATAFRELQALDSAGLALSDGGRRTVTEAGLAYLEQVL